MNAKYHCRHCGRVDKAHLRYVPMKKTTTGEVIPNRRHLGVYCGICNRWIRWVSQQ